MSITGIEMLSTALGLQKETIEAQRSLLIEVLGVLESGQDFQLGPRGKHRELLNRLRAAVKP